MSRFTAETLIRDAEFSRRVFNALVGDGMTTLGDVCKCDEAYLKRLSNLGKLSLAEIKEVLAYAGLGLRVGPKKPEPKSPGVTPADVSDAYLALQEQRAWYANAGKIDLRKWCVEMAIRWPVVHFRTGQDMGYINPASTMGYINPASAIDADVLGRAEKIWDWISKGNR